MPKDRNKDADVVDFPVDIDLDLDALEKPEELDVPAFRTKIGDRVLEFSSPDDLDWQDLAYLSNPTEIFQYVLSDEDLEYFNGERMPGWKLNALMEAYDKHFKLSARVSKAQREADRAERRRGR